MTADDFGLAEEVNEAVEAAHCHGILSAASLMVGAPAAADAIRRARRLPRLRVGLHVVLVDGSPLLRAEDIPGLVDATGRLRPDLINLAFAIACRPQVRHQVRREIAAQFEAYSRTGLPLDHVDVHKHFHLHPFVAREIITTGLRYGMRALRVPREPWGLLQGIDGCSLAVSRLMHAWTHVLGAQAHRHGLVTPDAVFGVHWSGALTRGRLVHLLERLPHGLIEIYGHPAMSDRFAGHCPGYGYVDELNALRAPETSSALHRSGFSLGGYADALAGQPDASASSARPLSASLP